MPCGASEEPAGDPIGIRSPCGNHLTGDVQGQFVELGVIEQRQRLQRGVAPQSAGARGEGVWGVEDGQCRMQCGPLDPGVERASDTLPAAARHPVPVGLCEGTEAGWLAVARVLLNLDETITRE